MMNLSELKKAAEELNYVLGITPPIETNLESKSEKELEKLSDYMNDQSEEHSIDLSGLGEIDLKKSSKEEVVLLLLAGFVLIAYSFIKPDEDELTPETTALAEKLKEGDFEFSDLEGERTTDEEDLEDDVVDLNQEIENAVRLKDLKDICKDYEEFKSLRGKLTSYNAAADLKKDMLKMLTGPPEETEPEEPKAPKTPKTQKEMFPQKKSTMADRVKFLTPLIKEGKYTRDELADKAAKEFPDLKLSTLQTILQDAKNPKYNKFSKLVVQDENGIMSFKK